MAEKTYPLIIVFYLDREMMKNASIIKPFAESVERILAQKNSNAIAFFLPAAEGAEERVECINPLVIPEVDMSNINKIIEDIKTSFSINDETFKDITNDKITPKTCKCENGEKCTCGTN